MKKISDIHAIKIILFITACYVGLWSIRIPTIKDQLLTDYIGVSYIMLTFATGSIVAMIFSNSLILKTSTKKILTFTLIAEGCLWLPVPFISELWVFMIFSFIFGMSYGAFEIACNVYASNVEIREKKSMMSGFHAFWSLGVLVGSVITSLMLEWNYSFIFNILLYVIILLPLSLYFVSCLEIQTTEKTDESNKKNIFFIWPILIFLLVFISMANAITEGSVDAWGALYMRDFIQVDGFKIGLATLCFNIFMVLGRLSGDWLRDKIGVFLLILILFLSTIISLLILTNYNNIFVSIIGFSLLGIGASSIVPIAYSLAGKIKGIDSGVGITIISIAVYATFIGAPASLGFIANNYGINNIFIPMLFAFVFLLMPITYFRKKFSI
ncbi:MFS transporter [Pelagibacteraceae bacterium]|nr:MFS transporter [Pelagibacteraceae bacterium]